MLDYRDAYLSKFCNLTVETLAADEVDLLGTFAAAWRDKLTVLKAYMMVCLENQAESEDLFSAKYKIYSREFDAVLTQARAASVADGDSLPTIFAIPLERA